MGRGPNISFHIAQTTPENVLFEDLSMIFISKNATNLNYLKISNRLGIFKHYLTKTVASNSPKLRATFDHCTFSTQTLPAQHWINNE
jgi:hypothetical protein